ncbi:N-acetylmuramoyl-L-alanine amidase/putative S-layer protein [Geobacillus stearothermophilus]|uniref:N-acetylmuramoyl-L-alanine amidase/putative S-layer protein n=1 Tax=Geobacillus stearothermophilus TaxID=1422 RepID=A0ABQ7HBW8_GEOSE|nr:phosphodiester glycosidase family protein [Geobacillus stearothermophilus]KAF6509683.1 N-acetylmuramoyl-L-alanine amidase/putative S-layer protein [Geobacillus stearothermophilus]OAO78445.1 N-acetylmuramoyl-L-alanine amidase/putative S-layer protein [Geobacillus stearothermophilus]
MGKAKNIIRIGVGAVLAAWTALQAAEADAGANVVYWEGMRLVQGQIGKLEIVKPINLWKRENGVLTFVRVLQPGEQYRVYSYDEAFGGQYGVGGGYYVTNIKGHVVYKTPSREKLKLVNPGKYGARQLAVGTVVKEVSTRIASGVEKEEMEIVGARGKQHVYKLDIDTSNERLAIETALSNDQVLGIEPVLEQAKRYDGRDGIVLAAVNGDYFKEDGSPTDLMVHRGEIVMTNTTPAAERTIFGISADGKPMIGNPDVQIGVRIGEGGSYPVDGINKPRRAHQLILYTPYFAASTKTNALGTEVVLTNVQGVLNGNGTITATVKKVVVGQGNEPLQPGELVLSGHGRASDYLRQAKEGDAVEISLQYDQPEWSGVKEALGGRYRLVADGKVQPFSIKGVHPRTAVGIDKNGNVMLVVVDGRQPAHSQGMTLNELAKLMHELGAVDAMTLDGGGSSTFVVRQPNGQLKVENKPSDGFARPVANALLVVYKETQENGESEEVLDDFEAESKWNASGVNYVGAAVERTTEKVREGKQALKISYDFRGMPGTSGVYASREEAIWISKRPQAIGMWVYGDGSGHWLRAQLQDGSGRRIWIDFARHVDWIGWKYVQAAVPSDVALPLMLEMPVRYMETDIGRKNAGAIYIDGLRAIFR